MVCLLRASVGGIGRKHIGVVDGVLWVPGRCGGGHKGRSTAAAATVAAHNRRERVWEEHLSRNMVSGGMKGGTTRESRKKRERRKRVKKE